EEVSFAQNGNDLCLLVSCLRLQDFDFAFFDDAEHPGRLSLPVNEIAGAIKRMQQVLRLIRIEKAEITRKKNVPRPIESDFNPAGPGRQFKEVDAAPHEPGYKAGSAQAEHFRHGLVPSDGTQLSKSLEAEWPGAFAFENPHKIERGLPALPFGKLSGR